MESSHLWMGKEGEKAGVAYLRKRGYRILEVNYRTFLGEIDCIATCGSFLVFVEIKTRSGTAFGFPEEAVGKRKQEKIIRSAEFYLKRRFGFNRPIRFDVLSVFSDGNQDFRFHLIEDAFECSGG